MLKIIIDLVANATYNAYIDSELVRIKPKKEDIIMLTIKLDSQVFNHKDQIIRHLEDEIRDLALYIDYEVVPADYTSVDYPQDEYFAMKVYSVLVRLIDEFVGF